MKRIKYIFLSTEINHGTEKNPNIEQIFISKDFRYSEESHDAAKREAYNGEYEIYDDDQSEPDLIPAESEILDARLTYIEMMTGLLEV